MKSRKFLQVLIFIFTVSKEVCKSCLSTPAVYFEPLAYIEAKLPQKPFDYEHINSCQYPFVWLMEDCITVVNNEFVDHKTAFKKCNSIRTRLYDLETKSKIKKALVMNFVGKRYGWDSYWVRGQSHNLKFSHNSSQILDLPLCEAISWRGIHVRYCEEKLGFLCVAESKNRTNVQSFWNGIIYDFENKTNFQEERPRISVEKDVANEDNIVNEPSTSLQKQKPQWEVSTTHEMLNSKQIISNPQGKTEQFSVKYSETVTDLSTFKDEDNSFSEKKTILKSTEQTLEGSVAKNVLITKITDIQKTATSDIVVDWSSPKDVDDYEHGDDNNDKDISVDSPWKTSIAASITNSSPKQIANGISTDQISIMNASNVFTKSTSYFEEITTMSKHEQSLSFRTEKPHLSGSQGEITNGLKIPAPNETITDNDATITITDKPNDNVILNTTNPKIFTFVHDVSTKNAKEKGSYDYHEYY